MFYFYLKCLSSSWVLVPTGSLPVVPGDPAGPPSSVSCLDLQHPPRGWWALPWLSFPALVKIHREVGNGFMIKAELDLYQRRFPSWKSEPLENSLDPRGRLLDCPHRLAWKEKGAGPQIGPAFNVNPPEQSVWPQAAVCVLCFHGPVSMACLVTGKTGMGRAGKRIGNLTALNISNEEATITGMTRSGVPCKTERTLSPGWTPFQQ